MKNVLTISTNEERLNAIKQLVDPLNFNIASLNYSNEKSLRQLLATVPDIAIIDYRIGLQNSIYLVDVLLTFGIPPIIISNLSPSKVRVNLGHPLAVLETKSLSNLCQQDFLIALEESTAYMLRLQSNFNGFQPKAILAEIRKTNQLSQAREPQVAST